MFVNDFTSDHFRPQNSTFINGGTRETDLEIEISKTCRTSLLTFARATRVKPRTVKCAQVLSFLHKNRCSTYPMNEQTQEKTAKSCFIQISVSLS